MANKYMERCSTLLINHKNANQNHNKTSPQTHQHGYDQKKKNPQINAGKDVEKGEHSHTVGGKINWSRHCGKKHGGFPKN